MASLLLALCCFGVASFLGLVGLQTNNQTSRWILLPIIFAFSATAFSVISSLPFPPAVALLVGLVTGQFMVVWFSNIICLLVVECHTLQTSPPSGSSWIAAYHMLFSSRRVPTLVLAERKSSSRRTFAVRQMGRIIACMGIQYCATFIPILLEKAMERFGLPTVGLAEQTFFFRRISHVSVFELILRAVTVIEFVAGTWALTNFFHTILSLIAVCLLQLDLPEEWPPLFGDIRASYSIRSFWSRYWHRLVSSTWLSLSSPILRSVFGVKSPRGTAARILSTALVFLFSGATHGVVTWKQGFSCGWWEEVSWFGMNFIAILVEDMVKKHVRVPTLGWAKTVIGYCWTWGFLFWSVPKVLYPKSECYPTYL